MTTTTKRWLARWMLLNCALVIGLALAEGAARLVGNVNPPMTERDAMVGQLLVRDFDGWVYDAEAQRKIPVRTNREGFRGPDWTEQKPAGVRRLAVLGDSMIAALGVEEPQTLVAQLEQGLNRQPAAGATRWEVLNFGVPGSSTAQQLALWRHTVHRYQPDVVLCAFFVGNDLTDNSPRISSNPRIYFDLDPSGRLVQLPLSAAKTGLSAWLNRYCRLYLWQKMVIRNVRDQWIKQHQMLEAGHWIYAKQQPPDVAHAWRLTGALLAELGREVRQHGARFGVVLIPTAQQIYTDSFQKLLPAAGTYAPQFDADYPDRRLAELCHAAAVPMLSLTADFRRAAPDRTLANSDQWLFFRGEGHLNARGNQLAAEVIGRWLAAGNPPPLGTPHHPTRRTPAQ
jgi:lysophospholipase L1-like esterase